MPTLLTDFYEITGCEPSGETEWTIDLRLNPAHAIYGGHFPGHSIVPGVCSLQMIKECAERIAHASLRYRQVASCKFLAAVDPQTCDTCRLRISLKSDEAGIRQLRAEGEWNGCDFIKLKATLTDGQA